MITSSADLKPRIYKAGGSTEETGQRISQLSHAKKLIAEGNEKEGGLALFRALPRHAQVQAVDQVSSSEVGQSRLSFRKQKTIYLAG